MKEKILFTLYSLIFGILNSQDIKPEDEIYFSLTISSFGKFSGPNVK